MKRSALVAAAVLLAAFASSCGKGTEMERKKYPTVDEAALKGVVRTNYDSPEPTEEQRARKAKSIARLKEMGLPYIDHLPVVEDERQVKPRDPQEVAKRCLAVALCAVKGETQGKDEALVADLVKRFGAEAYFSPQEAAFIKDRSPKRQDFVNFCWRYECAHVLLWSLGHLDELKPPNAICDVPREVRLIREAGPEAFVAKARLRSQAEILDMADFYYRLHWAALNLRLKGDASDEVNEEIVQERHRALNWLIRYMGQDWDDVTTDT